MQILGLSAPRGHTWGAALRGIATLGAVAALWTVAASCTGYSVLHPRLAVTEPVRGAWSIATPAEVRDAGQAGITLLFTYADPPIPADPIGQELLRQHIRVIDARIGARVRAYQCHRTFDDAPPTPGNGLFCSDDTHYTKDELDADIDRIIRDDAANPLIAGLWILDDTAPWDPGVMRRHLDYAHDRASGLPTICGFAASVNARGGYWDPRTAANFSEQACDYIAPYIYATPRTSKDETTRTADWTMQTVLPAMLGDLIARGWRQAGTPILGVGQAWGGTNVDSRRILDPPTTETMLTQARSYCAAGAIGVAWYAWHVDQYRADRTPATRTSLLRSVATADALVRTACHSQRYPSVLPAELRHLTERQRSADRPEPGGRRLPRGCRHVDRATTRIGRSGRRDRG